MDSYGRLISRLYESLIVLDIIYKDKVIGPHRMTKSSMSDPRHRLGTILRDLAHTCDSEKGGPSTAAIGLQEGSNCYTFWIAQNQGCTDKAKLFLEEVLGILKKALDMKEKERRAIQHQLFKLYIQYAEKRVLKEIKNLNKAVRKCKKSLVDSDRPEGKGTRDSIFKVRY
jgi:hypothetical protein